MSCDNCKILDSAFCPGNNDQSNLKGEHPNGDVFSAKWMSFSILKNWVKKIAKSLDYRAKGFWSAIHKISTLKIAYLSKNLQKKARQLSEGKYVKEVDG